MSGSDVLVVALRATTALGAIGLGLSAACGDGPGSEAFALGGLTRATCDKLVECGCIATAEADYCQVYMAYLFAPPYQYTPNPDDGYYYAHGYDSGYDGPVQLAFDPQCAAELEARIGQLDCRTIPFFDNCEDYCPLYHGTHWQGQRCTIQDTFATDCAKGLACISGECRNPCDVVVALEGQPCDAIECAPGLSCENIGLDPNLPDQDVCVALPVAGQPCLGNACAASAWCDQTDPENPMCQPLRQLGEECFGHSQCESFNCPRGFCEAPAQIGDACDDSLPCGPGLGCEDGVCVEQWAICGLLEIEYYYY